jgi:hypothetical protein
MPGSGDNGTVRTLVMACSVRSGDVYQRYVSGLYRQARCHLSPCQAARGEWDAYAGVGPVGQCGAA